MDKPVVKRTERVEANLKRVKELLKLISNEVDSIAKNAPDNVEYSDYYSLLEMRSKLADLLGIDDYDPE